MNQPFDLLKLWYAKSKEYPHGKIHVAGVASQVDFFTQPVLQFNPLCGAQIYGLELVARVQSKDEILKKATCKKCRGRFDGTLSKQNGRNASGQKNHPWNVERYGKLARGSNESGD